MCRNAMPGDRIRLVSMPEDPDPIPAGTLGTVLSVTNQTSLGSCWYQIDVQWDNGRTLMLSVPPDNYQLEDDQ